MSRFNHRYHDGGYSRRAPPSRQNRFRLCKYHGWDEEAVRSLMQLACDFELGVTV